MMKRLKIYGIWVLIFALMLAEPCVYASGTVSGNAVDCDGNVIQEPPVKILLVGNSLTRFIINRDGRGIQEYLELMAGEAGKDVYIKTVAFGGTSLQSYAGMNPKKKRQQRTFNRLLKSQDWDYVIIQELSKLYYKNYEKKSVPAVKKLLKKIKKEAPDAQVMLYVPRGYDAIAKRSKTEMSAFEMECYMGAAGERLAARFDIPVIPVGMHFYRCSILYPEIRMLGPDSRRHPTRAGYFLTAACVYQKIFEEKPQLSGEILKTAGISKRQAEKLVQLWDESISVNTIEKTLTKGETYQIKASAGDVRFTSLDEKIVSANDVTGEITALRSGMTVVVAETSDAKQAYCTVYVPFEKPEKLRSAANTVVDESGKKQAKVTLKWKKQPGASYEVYGADKPKGPYTLLARVRKNRYEDVLTDFGTQRYYKIRAVNDYKACSSKKTKAFKVELYGKN